jgi:hypothetical protein
MEKQASISLDRIPDPDTRATPHYAAGCKRCIADDYL